MDMEQPQNKKMKVDKEDEETTRDNIFKEVFKDYYRVKDNDVKESQQAINKALAESNDLLEKLVEKITEIFNASFKKEMQHLYIEKCVSLYEEMVDDFWEEYKKKPQHFKKILAENAEPIGSFEEFYDECNTYHDKHYTDKFYHFVEEHDAISIFVEKTSDIIGSLNDHIIQLIKDKVSEESYDDSFSLLENYYMNN